MQIISDIECGLCIKQFTVHNNKPVSLPCGHTLCQSCAKTKTTSEKQLVCPWDNQVHPVTADDLPINQEILESLPETDIAPPHCLDDPEVLKENADCLVLKQELTLGDFSFGEGPNLHGEILTQMQTVQMNDTVYYGQTIKKSGLRHGKGKQTWKDGSVYEGWWVYDKANGSGRLIHADGDYYIGQWNNDKAQGFGQYVHMNGARYEGMWQDDRQHGQGTETWPDGAVYEGEYQVGKKHGSGSFKWNDGSRYVGRFSHNNIDGQGHYLWSDGRQYVGEWKTNKMHGYGIFSWPDGKRYEGQYNQDKKEGHGVFYWSNGSKYEGGWKNGKQHGKGTYISSSGAIRVGMWNEGVRTAWIEDTVDKDPACALEQN